MKQPIILLAILSFSSCQVKNSTDNTSIDSLNAVQDSVPLQTKPSSNAEFTNYLSGFKAVALPFSAINPDSLSQSSEPNDQSIYKNIRGERAFRSWWFYKKITTDKNYIAVITVELNSINNFVAVLETYTPDGANIDARVLDFGFEEYGNPSGSVEIRKDLSISITATSLISQYDEGGNEIPNSQKRKLFSIDGKILDDGKIKLSETSDTFIE